MLAVRIRLDRDAVILHGMREELEPAGRQRRVIGRQASPPDGEPSAVHLAAGAERAGSAGQIQPFRLKMPYIRAAVEPISAIW